MGAFFCAANCVDFKETDLQRAQLGLAHSFSRNRVQFDVNRQDKPIIQGNAVIEIMDVNLNTLAMRVKEWFSWHFPELAKIVNDNEMYCRLVNLVKVTGAGSLDGVGWRLEVEQKKVQPTEFGRAE